MIDITPAHDFFVGIDSDGCAFDNMELKHKECFIPNTVKHWNLQGVSKYAREAAEFVNLYSQSRGINRFPALVETLQWLQRRPEVRSRGVQVTVPAALVEWIESATMLSNPPLEKRVDQTGDPGLIQALEWSQAVNLAIGEIVHGVPPFPCVRESLDRLNGMADCVVVSATPNEALQREWVEHDLAQYVVAICGQDLGTKKQHLQTASRYAPNHALMIGDAPGDHKAAQANDCLFYPINPGAEEQSWQRFFEEAVDRFQSGTFAGSYQQSLLDEFATYLPRQPPWPVVDD